MGIKIGFFSGRFDSVANSCCTSSAAAFMTELFLFASVVFYFKGDFHHERNEFIVTDMSGGSRALSPSLWHVEDECQSLNPGVNPSLADSRTHPQLSLSPAE